LSSADSLMCSWDLCTTNLVALGAQCEFAVHGMLRATFLVCNKLVCLEQCFDVMGIAQQLRSIYGRNELYVVPNTHPLALEQCSEPRIVVDGPNFNVVFVNDVSACYHD
jgi:hypothetical protein